jgi:hypothetical protein
MAQEIRPYSSWSLEDHEANIYQTSKGNTCSVRLVQGVHPGEVCKVHLLWKGESCFSNPGESSHRRVWTILSCFNRKT